MDDDGVARPSVGVKRAGVEDQDVVVEVEGHVVDAVLVQSSL
jgi:hypothetical protein